MGSLSKLWYALNTAAAALQDGAELAVETVFLIEQTNNLILYHRRLSALTRIMKNFNQAKSRILLENLVNDLFEREFRDQITDTMKSQNNQKNHFQRYFKKNVV